MWLIAIISKILICLCLFDFLFAYSTDISATIIRKNIENEQNISFGTRVNCATGALSMLISRVELINANSGTLIMVTTSPAAATVSQLRRLSALTPFDPPCVLLWLHTHYSLTFIYWSNCILIDHVFSLLFIMFVQTIYTVVNFGR